VAAPDTFRVLLAQVPVALWPPLRRLLSSVQFGAPNSVSLRFSLHQGKTLPVCAAPARLPRLF
jgi:hypothetical protein